MQETNTENGIYSILPKKEKDQYLLLFEIDWLQDVDIIQCTAKSSYTSDTNGLSNN